MKARGLTNLPVWDDEHGILKGEQKYYVSLAHTADDVKDTIAAWESAIGELKQ